MFLLGLILLTVAISATETEIEQSSSSCSIYKLNQERCLANKDTETGEQCVYLSCNAWPEYACQPMYGCESTSYASSICKSNPSYTCHYSTNSVKNSFVYSEAALLDQVTELPGLINDLSYNQFSGYIQLPGTKKNIHYWLVEAEQDADLKPLVFWTNGGPGCSGLIGFLTEQGPFRPTESGDILLNPYAWNKIANMVFLEQPVGVGFSYSDVEDDYKIGDDQAAKDNLATILGLIERFPHFNHSDLHITSESYGGHYMPTLANEIINYNDAQEYNQEKLNFKGFAVGNPYTDYYSGVGAEMETYWGKQLLPKPLWDKYVANGCLNVEQELNNSVCSTLMLNFMRKIGNLNPYALDYPVCLSAQQMTMRDYLKAELLVNDSLDIKYEPCEDAYSATYLNRDDVKSALHVHSDIVWEECSRTTKYEMKDKMLPMEKYYRTLLNSKTHPELRILVYSGDDDSVCGTIGTQRWIYDLGFPVTKDWNTWYVDGQTAGYITTFKTPFSKDSRFSFVTVHGAGHEVPTYKPKEALELFEMYLSNTI
jgi:carboxypeptidase C (cathepsin A)